MATSSLRAAMAWADKLVEEYLLFRGFMQAHRTFIAETKSDRLHEFQVDKIVEELLRLLTSFQYQAMMELWGFLQERFFSRLQHSYWSVIHHLETSLQRFYLVNAIQSGQPDKVRMFFESQAEDIRGDEEWAAWFQLPFLKDPASDPTFKVFFSKEWASRLVVSVHNLLTTVFHHIRLPALLSLHLSSKQLSKLTSQVEELERKGEAQEREKRELLQRLSGGITPAAPPGDVAQEMAAERGEGGRGSEEPGRGAGESAERVTRSAETETTRRSGAGEEEEEEEEERAGAGVVEAESSGMFTVTNTTLFPGHSSACTCARFSAEASTLASASKDSTIRLHALSAGQTERAATIFLTAPALSLAWEPRSDRLLCIGSEKGDIKCWDADAKKMLFEASSGAAFPKVRCLSANPDGQSVVAACATKQGTSSLLQTYSLRTGKATQTLEGKGGSCVRAVHHNHNGSLLTSATQDRLVQLFDLRSASVIAEWRAHDDACTAVLFSPDQTSIFTAGLDGVIKEWSSHAQGKELNRWTLPASSGEAARPDHVEMALNAEGSHLIASSSLLSSAFVYSTKDVSAPPQAVAHAGQASVQSVDWSLVPAATSVLAAASDGVVRVLDMVEVEK